MNGPINIRPKSKAVPIHAASSNPNPWWPLKSGIPSEIMRLVSVTVPAPIRTPRIPSRGLFDSSEGRTLEATNFASCSGVGTGVTLVVLDIVCLLSPRADSHDDREARAQLAGQFRVVERDLDGDSLNDFGEIPGGIIRRQQGKLRSAGRSDLDDFAPDDLSRVCVNTDLCGIAYLDIGELGLPIICLYPFRDIDERDHLRPRRNQLSRTDLPFPNRTVSRGVDLGVAKVYLCYYQIRLLGTEVSIELYFLRLQYCLRTPFGFGSQLIATKHSLGLSQIGVTAGKLSGNTFFVSNSYFNSLLSRGVSLE